MKNKIFFVPIFTLLVPFTFAETYSAVKIADHVNICTDRRPIHVGFYDASVNQTFICWMGLNSHPIVKAFNHATDTWSEDKIVGHSQFVDKHNYPALVRGPDDHIVIFYGCHNSDMRMTKSPNPLSIDGEWLDKDIPESYGASYPAPIVTVDGTIYVFFRYTRQTNGYTEDRPYEYIKSTDNGATWTRHKSADPYPRDTDNTTEVYNGKVTYEPPHGDQKAKIHIAWTLCGPRLGTHAHATYGQNVYYAYLDPENDHMFNVEGVDMGDYIDTVEDDSLCKVLDTGITTDENVKHLAGLQVSVHYMDNGLPIIHFDNRPGGGLCSAVWDGSCWEVTQIGAGESEPRDIEKIGPESFRIYTTGDTVKTYITTDAGKHWDFESAFPAGQSVSRCIVIDNYHPDIKLLLTDRVRSVRSADGNILIGKVTSK